MVNARFQDCRCVGPDTGLHGVPEPLIDFLPDQTDAATIRSWAKDDWLRQQRRNQHPNLGIIRG
jgi:hypothetical protein